MRSLTTCALALMLAAGPLTADAAAIRQKGSKVKVRPAAFKAPAS